MAFRCRYSFNTAQCQALTRYMVLSSTAHPEKGLKHQSTHYTKEHPGTNHATCHDGEEWAPLSTRESGVFAGRGGRKEFSKRITLEPRSEI